MLVRPSCGRRHFEILQEDYVKYSNYVIIYLYSFIYLIYLFTVSHYVQQD